jgi:hypothetical protein
MTTVKRLYRPAPELPGYESGGSLQSSVRFLLAAEDLWRSNPGSAECPDRFAMIGVLRTEEKKKGRIGMRPNRTFEPGALSGTTLSA